MMKTLWKINMLLMVMLTITKEIRAITAMLVLMKMIVLV